jgi:glycosyltransferase involved in cell wall biosynthesis
MARVAFVINDLRTGGAERVFSSDAVALAARGHEVSVYLLYGTRADTFALSIPPSISTHELKARGPFDLFAMRRLLIALREQHVEIVLSTLNDANLFARFGLIGAPRIRLIRREANTMRMKPWWHKIFDVVFDWRTHAIIAVSKDVAAGIPGYNPFIARKIVVLPNAVLVPSQSADAARAELILCVVGSLTRKKDQATIVRACGILHRKGIPFTLSIAGEGSERVVLEHLAQVEGVAESVRFLGVRDHSAVQALYLDSSVFVMASRNEGSPNALLEAMAAGLPCIGADIPSVREAGGDAIVLFPPGDAVVLADILGRLYRDSATRARIGARAREIVQERNVPEKRYLLLESILYGKTH